MYSVDRILLSVILFFLLLHLATDRVTYRVNKVYARMLVVTRTTW